MKTKKFFSALLFLMIILLSLTPGTPASAAVVAAPADQSTTQASPVPLLVTVMPDSATVEAGAAIGFTIKVTNAGKSPANDVEVRDQLSSQVPWKADRAECSVSSMGLLSCKFGTLAPQDSIKVHVTATSTNALQQPIINTAEAWGSNSTKTLSNQASLTVKCGADITVTKTAVADQVTGGQQVSFTILVSNIGSLFADNVTLTDPLPTNPGLSWSIEPAVTGCSINENGTLLCDFGKVDVGDQFNRSVTIVSPTTRATCGANNNGVIDNTATVASTNELSNYVGNNTSEASIRVFCPDLDIVKTADRATAQPGETVGFTVKVTNYTSSPITAVELADQLDQRFSWQSDNTKCSISANQALSCALGTLAATGSASVHVTATPANTFCGDIINTASVVATGFGRLSSNEAQVSIPCKTDVSVTKTAAAISVKWGSPVSFTMTVKNNSSLTAQNVTLTDPLPQVQGMTWTLSGQDAADCTNSGTQLDCNFHDLPALATRVVTVTSPTNGQSCTVVSNTATVSTTGEAQEDLKNNTAKAETSVYGCTGPELEVIKDADHGEAHLGETVDFTINITNKATASAAANGVVLTDLLDNRLAWTTDTPECSISANQTLTCNFSTLAIGTSAKAHVTAPVVPAVCNTDVKNTATAQANNHSKVASNEALVIVKCDSAKPDVKVTKTAERPAFRQGDFDFRFLITVENVGKVTADQVKLVDTINPSPLDQTKATLTWQIEPSAYSSKCVWTKANQEITCDFGSIPVGSNPITITVSSPSALFLGSVNNKAVVSAASEPADNQLNNYAEASASDTAGPICISSNLYNGAYNNDYEGMFPGSTGVSHYKITTAPVGRKFLGDFGNEMVTMAFSCVPTGTAYLVVSFDLYIINTWDGNATYAGPDHWQWGVLNGPIMLNTNFTNWDWLRQSYPLSFGEGDFPYQTMATGVNDLGYIWSNRGGLDSTYHLTALVPYTENPEQTITLYFKGFGLQTLADESWGLDNFSVKTLKAMPNRYYFPMFFHNSLAFAAPAASSTLATETAIDETKIPQLQTR